MLLPQSLRDLLVDELDEFLKALPDDPDAEVVANYVVEVLESWADEAAHDDLLIDMEEEGALEAPFLEALETEMSSNDEFEFTGEEIAVLVERMCEVEWEENPDSEDEDEDEDEDDL